MNTSKCKEWANERLSPSPRNPLTNRLIKKDGPKYKQLDKECNDLIVDINPICMEWLKKNHNNLYLQLGTQPQPKPKVKASVQPKVKASVQPSIITEDEDEEPVPSGQKFYTISERQGFNGEIKSYFASAIIEEGKACMTNTKTLLKYVVDPKLLGFGSFGNVYGVKIPNKNIKVAIKEGRLGHWEFRRALKKNYPIEYLYNKLINDLIDDKICPNFSYTYSIYFCDSCSLKTLDNKTVNAKCSETVVELFDYTLNKLKDLRDEVILSILFQVFFGLAVIQIEYGMFHNDIKKENILIKEIPPGGYWEYYLNNTVYKVPNYGYISALNDFGVSKAYRQGFADKQYGYRHAEVLRDPKTNDYFFKPFNTQFYPSLGKTGKVTKIDSPIKRDGFTYNSFHQNFDSKPSIPVDLNDMVRFPDYYFHYDIVDAIHMIIGGRRTGQPGDHIPMKVSHKLKSMLEPLFHFVKIPDGWRNVYEFSAHVTIEKLFDTYTKVASNGPKIETYRLNFRNV